MMKDFMTEAIEGLREFEEQRISLLLPEQTRIEWFPILACDRANIVIGLLESGSWVIEGREGLIVLNNVREFVRAIMLLEQPLSSIQEQLRRTFGHLQLEYDVNEVFPFIEIVQAGFEQQSEYWAQLAFNWFEGFSPERKKQLEHSLDAIISSKWASQKLRHKARKELHMLACLKDT